MKKFGKEMAIVVVAFGIVLSGCSAASTGTPIPESNADVMNPVISATGIVVPEQWAALSVRSSGVVDEILVNEGDEVIQSTPLLRLNGQEQAGTAVTAAQLELDSAERAVEQLVDDAASIAAQSQKDMVAARNALDAAERELDKYEEDAYLEDIKTAKRDVKRELDQLEERQKKYNKYVSLPEDNDTREYYLERLQDQQRDYDEAVRDLSDLEMEKAGYEAESAKAKALLDKATKQYDDHKNGPAQADKQVAESRVANARAQLEAAQKNLDNLLLKAPFDGVVSSIKVRAGEYVSTGQSVLMFAGSTPLIVETTDLNEIDVARIRMGDPVSVTFDAIPEDVIEGKVVRIGKKSTEGSGVNYTIRIELSQVPDGLLWGMTAFVDIQVQK